MNKKITLLLSFLVIAAGVNAQSRKTWNFMKGFSAATEANLLADTKNWSGTTEFTNITGLTENSEFKANGVTIPETSGLWHGGAGAKHMKIGVKPATKNSLWPYVCVNGNKNGDFLRIPKVGPGSTITVAYRGNKVNTGIKSANEEYVSYSGVLLTDSAKNASKDSTICYIHVAEDCPDSIPVTIMVNGGTYIYQIIIDEGDAPEGDVKVGYVFDSSYPNYSYDSDLIPQMIQANFTQIDIKDYTAESSIDELMEYEVVMLTDAIAENHPFASKLKNLLAFVPIVNLNTKLYRTWDWADVSLSEGGASLFASTEGLQSKLFDNIAKGEEGDFTITNSAPIYGYEAYFSAPIANDSVLATVGTKNTIARHGNYGYNDYILVPASLEVLADPTENVITLINNALDIVKETKQVPTAATTPKFSCVYDDAQTTVTITQGNKGSIVYYTTDGSEPTTNSNVYSTPLVFSSQTTIKSFATCEGYYDSEIASQDVEIFTRLSTPQISYKKNPDETTVSITADEGATIYWNTVASNDTLKSVIYTGPFTLNRPFSCTAFAVQNGYLPSEVTTTQIPVDITDLRNDTLLHMDSNTTDYMSGDIISRSSYFDTSQPRTDSTFLRVDTIWNEEKTEYTLKNVYYRYVYPILGTLHYVDFGTGWAVGSYGQWIQNCKGTATDQIGGAYGPATPTDIGYTSRAVSFYGVGNSYDPLQAWLQTTVKVQAPFDIVTYMSSDNSTLEVAKVYVSSDSVQWTQIDSLSIIGKAKQVQRLVTKYNGTDSVYIKYVSATPTTAWNAGAAVAPKNVKTMFFDIIVLGPGGEVVLPGDANDDGMVDVADITAIASYILGSTPSVWNAKNADANNDNQIDVADITATASIILGTK